MTLAGPWLVLAGFFIAWCGWGMSDRWATLLGLFDALAGAALITRELHLW